MKKVICLIAISLMVISVCQAKTITWVEDSSITGDIKDKRFTVEEEKTETVTKSMNITEIEHEIQQFEARIEHLEMLKAEKELELKDIEKELKLVKVDGEYTVTAIAIEK